MSVCPYCFEPFDARTAAFRCMNRNAPEQCLEPDIALADFQGRLRYDDKGVPSADPERRVILRRSSPLGRLRAPPSSTDCPTCGARTTRAVCARCHNDLPSQYRATDARSIALVGPKFSGKTNYVGVLIHELQGRVGQRFGATLQATDEQTIKRYNTHFRRLLFEEQVVIPATATVTASPELRYPLAYQLKVGREGRAQVMSLVFFDTAGEDLEEGELLEQEARYVANADAVIVLVDPLQIAGVRDRLARPDVELPEVRSDPLDMVTRVTNAIRAQRGIPPAHPIDRPLALVLSKLDAVRGLMDPDSRAVAGDGHDGVYDENDAEEVHESVRSHVHEWAGPALENFVGANYRLSRWFGTSAFGRPPTGTQLPAGVSPVRVEDPVLWLLAQWGMIRSTRGSR